MHVEVPLGEGDGLGLASGVWVGLLVGLELGRGPGDREADAEDETGLPLTSGLSLSLGR